MDTAPSSPRTPYVLLGVGNAVFAIRVDSVSEILPLRPMTRLPGTPPDLPGRIAVRDQPVSLIDLRSRLGLPTAPATERTRVLVLDGATAGQGWGLVADQIFDVGVLDEDRLRPLPEGRLPWRSDSIAGIGRHCGDFVIVLDLDLLLAPLLPRANPPDPEAGEWEKDAWETAEREAAE